jgi:hypothetical protein
MSVRPSACGLATARGVAALVLASALLSGCGTIRSILGIPPDPTVEIKGTEPRWLLIKNPRFGDVASEPEYVWVEEDKLPTTMRSLVFGKSTLLAPPEIVAKYGAPPGGGRISPRQKVPYQTAEVAAATSAPSAPAAETKVVTKNASPSRGAGAAAAPAPAPAPAAPPLRGYVVYVDPTRIVIDLAAQDGLRPGAVVSLRRDRIPIVHPITGELLGELDEEVATAKVVEVREKFSVLEVQTLAQGSEIKIKDRVLIR